MAIVKMKKFDLLVLESYREKLLRELQIFRNIQFEDVKDIEDFEDKSLERFKKPIVEEYISNLDENMNKSIYAIELISKYAPTVSGLKSLKEGLPNYTFVEMEKRISEIDFDKEYDIIKILGDELSSVELKISKKKEQIKELEPLLELDVSINEIDKLSRFNSILGGVSGKIVDNFNGAMSGLEYTYYEEIGVYKDEVFFFIISDKREEDELNEALRIGNFNKIKIDSDKLPRDSIEDIKNDIQKLENEKQNIISNISGNKDKLDDFKLVYDYLANIRVRELAKRDFMATSSVCMLSGYCPDFDTKRMEEIIFNICGEDYSLEFKDVDRDSDEIPILLKNNKIVRVFENITSTYALPKYNEVDPTPLYAPIYALFFGMMSADFGYGAVLLILTTLGLKLCNFTPDMKKNVKFFQLIGISTTIWGFLYGSYFGASIPGMWRLFDLSTQFMTILIISIIMGGIHLAYGLAIKAYMLIRDKQYVDMFFDVIAWYIVLASIIVLLLSIAGVLNPELKTIAKYGACLGIVLLIVGGARAVNGNIGAKIAAGIYNVYGISNYIGDFVSYSRLMALGMAGGYIAFSVNMIAGMTWGHTIIGYVASILILVIFHAFNLFLSCLGAYVHALRLIYVEFFGKFYEGGGKAFKFFRGKTRYINLDRHLEE
ncbi:V-type ATP synthase subunit I [Peptostreptococcus canis]|uniref:V-type ATP synthase subunit I n=1 Tax=Peptostreptococcus canis TaxID=1159213 RepID=UPI001FAE2DFE|nr:V-type ATP synthase subunit I [Peptostreptococcus canis]